MSSAAELTPAAPRIRVVVDRADSPHCGLSVGDEFLIDGPCLVTDGRELCSNALAAVAPLLAARQYSLPLDDWLIRKPYLSCPRAEDRVVLRLEAAPDEQEGSP